MVCRLAVLMDFSWFSFAQSNCANAGKIALSHTFISILYHLTLNNQCNWRSKLLFNKQRITLYKHLFSVSYCVVGYGTMFVCHCFGGIHSLYLSKFLWTVHCHNVEACSLDLHRHEKSSSTCMHSYIHTDMHTYVHLIIYLFIYLFTYVFIHLFIYSFIHSFIHSFYSASSLK